MSNGYHLDTAILADRIAIYDPNDTGDVVYIRSRKMTFGESRRVRSSAMQVSMNGAGMNGAVDPGEYQAALLLVYIIAWDGPTLQNVPITAEAIDNLDADFADAVLRRIDQIGTPEAVSDPKDGSAG